MEKNAGLLMLTLSDWWGRIVTALTLAVALFGGWRAFVKYRGDKLTVSRGDNKQLKADVARLLREATIRIDNEREYLQQIDDLQAQVSAQRTRITELLNGRTTQNTQSPNR